MSNEYFNSNGFKFFLDKYNGITIDKDSVKEKDFIKNLENLITKLKEEKRNLLWLHLDIKFSHLISNATKLGFKYHTCHENSLLLVKKLTINPIIPTASNHTLGVGVVVINKKNEVLLVKERFSNVGFKLPGGHIDDGELIQSAVIREVKEETGIDIEFESLISLGHFYPHQFDKSNLYILCKAKAKSYKIDISDTQEILECKWINVNTYLNDENTFEYNKKIVKAAIVSEGLKNEELESFNQIPKNYELFF